MKRLSIYATFVAILLCVSILSSISAEKKFEKKFPATRSGTLILNTDVGDVTISGTSASEVSIVAEIHGRQRDVDEFDISAWQNETGVEVKGKGRRSNWFRWFDDSPEVRFTIMVPREYSTRVNTSGGNIVITNLKGKIEGETSGGDLRISDIEGLVTLETSGGNIHAEKLTGNLHMETSGGDIELMAISGNVDVGTSGGNIRISDVDGKVRAETSGGDVVVRAKDGNKGIYAETSGGDIDIVVPRNIAATIDASTTGGEVTCDLPVTMSGRLDESRIRGTVNGGGNPIQAHTSGGDVRIKAAD
ncbi:MAG: hypothetical protein HW412_1219 [Bacteroidetes bacterium]|nr:hypothetical protein [Bacteroidota bacterium]